MPTVLRLSGYRFFFYASDCSELRHMHVEKGNGEAKFWLDPLALAFNHRFSSRQLREIERIIADHLEDLRKAWDDFCNPASSPQTI